MFIPLKLNGEHSDIEDVMGEKEQEIVTQGCVQ